jgi:hypothetical protein
VGDDYGLRVSSRFYDGPLWRLSARGLRLWVYLAMKAQHAATSRTMSDGQRVEVATGQWLTSARKLLREMGGGSLRTITRDLDELKAAGAISVNPIHGRYSPGNRGVTGSVTGTAPESNGGYVLATLVTVEGLGVRQGGVTEMVTKELRETRQSTSSPVSAKDRAELKRVEQRLAAEGR